jgi:hypothetical protein
LCPKSDLRQLGRCRSSQLTSTAVVVPHANDRGRVPTPLALQRNVPEEGIALRPRSDRATAATARQRSGRTTGTSLADGCSPGSALPRSSGFANSNRGRRNGPGRLGTGGSGDTTGTACLSNQRERPDQYTPASVVTKMKGSLPMGTGAGRAGRRDRFSGFKGGLVAPSPPFSHVA